MVMMANIKKILPCILFFIQIFVLLGAHPILQREEWLPEKALRPVLSSYPTFQDDMAFERLALAIERNIHYLERLHPTKIFQYGPHTFTCRQVLESQKAFLHIISQSLTQDALNRKIREHFRVYRATGRAGTRKVLFTGYYEPIFDASLTMDHIYKYPLYKKPDDLIRIDLALFNKKYKGERIVARIENNTVLPYYTRRQIMTEKVLAGKNLEIAWLKDPIDAYLLHIEGAGRLTLPDGNTLIVNYTASNGRPYRSFGRYLLENGYLSPTQMSIEKIRQYLSDHPKIIKKVLNYNASYTFFRSVEEGPLGNINVPLTMGRSLALDARLFPKGALAFISCRKPTVNSKGKITGWTDFSRFVLNQDTGSAIKGAGRADLFWGSGPDAETMAWHLKHDGDLYVLIKNPEKD